MCWDYCTEWPMPAEVQPWISADPGLEIVDSSPRRPCGFFNYDLPSWEFQRSSKGSSMAPVNVWSRAFGAKRTAGGRMLTSIRLNLD